MSIAVQLMSSPQAFGRLCAIADLIDLQFCSLFGKNKVAAGPPIYRRIGAHARNRCRRATLGGRPRLPYL